MSSLGPDWQSGLHTQPWTEQQARLVLEALRGSGQSIPQFARQYGVNRQRLHWWQKRLFPPQGAVGSPATVCFAPVRVVDSQPPVLQPDPPASCPGTVELLLGRGRRLRIGADFEEKTLLRVLHLLEEDAGC